MANSKNPSKGSSKVKEGSSVKIHKKSSMPKYQAPPPPPPKKKSK